MRNKHFYSHLFNENEFIEPLKILNVTEDQMEELIDVMDANIHHTVVTNICSQLEEGDKDIFLENLLKNNHEKTHFHLLQVLDDIEEMIKDTINIMKLKMIRDIEHSLREIEEDIVEELDR